MALEEGKDPVVSLIYRYVIDNVLLSLQHSTSPSFLPSEIKELEAAWIKRLQTHNAVLDVNTWTSKTQTQTRNPNRTLPHPSSIISKPSTTTSLPPPLPAKRLRENEADFFGPFAPLVHRSPHLPSTIRDDMMRSRAETKHPLAGQKEPVQLRRSAVESVGDAPPVTIPQVDGINDELEEEGEGGVGLKRSGESEDSDDFSDLDDEFLEQMRTQQSKEESVEDVQVEFNEVSFRPTTAVDADVLLGTIQSFKRKQDKGIIRVGKSLIFEDDYGGNANDIVLKNCILRHESKEIAVQSCQGLFSLREE